MNEEIFDRSKLKFTTKKTIKLVENKNDVDKKKEAISFLNKQLRLYNLDIKKLYNNIPEYSVRNVLLNIAYYVAEDEELIDIVTRRREIPYIKLAKRIGESKKFIEKYKDYLMLYILLIHNNKYKCIQNYLAIVDGREESTDIVVVEPEKDDKITGLVLKKNSRYAIVITHSGEIVRVKHQSSSIGYEVTGREKKGIMYYSRQIVALVLILVIAFYSVYYVYNKPKTTILISGTSTFKLEVNRYSKVIDIASKTTKGKRVIAGMTYQYQDIEYVLNELTTEIINNKMVPENSEISIIVSGDRLKNIDFRLMEQTVKDKNIENKTNVKIRINNSGLMK